MTEKRKKPIKLEITGELVSTPANDAVAVQVRGSTPTKTQSPAQGTPAALTGSVKLRREVKGRAGKPVAVLFGFDDPAAQQPGALKNLQAKLKETLACGGTFDETAGEIILQVDDLEKIRQTLGRMGFRVKG